MLIRLQKHEIMINKTVHMFLKLYYLCINENHFEAETSVNSLPT